MPKCPRCDSKIGQTDIRCAACGYEFPDPPPLKMNLGFAYSPLADVALIVGSIAAGLGCVGAVIGGIAAALQRNWVQALFLSPISFLLCFAMLVVFLRVQEK